MQHPRIARGTKGFTLIELLVVITIVTVLSTAVVVVLNPVQILRQARDSNRVSDLGTLRSALGLFLADASSTALAESSVTCYASIPSSGSQCGSRFSTNYSVTSGTTSRNVNGTGWVPVNFTILSSGSPLGNLPVDPSNGATYYYAYAANLTAFTFELNANLESTKYASGGSFDLESTDGGNDANLYEIGNDPQLDL